MKTISVAPASSSGFHHLESFEVFAIDATRTVFKTGSERLPTRRDVYRDTQVWVETPGGSYTFFHQLKWCKNEAPALESLRLNRLQWRGRTMAVAPEKIGRAMNELFSRGTLDPLEAALMGSFHTNFMLELISFCTGLATTEGEVADDVWCSRVESWLRSGGLRG